MRIVYTPPTPPPTPPRSRPTASHASYASAVASDTLRNLAALGVDATLADDAPCPEVQALARLLFGRNVEQLPARQKSRSGRLRKHDTANLAAHREHLAATRPELLADAELFPPHRIVPTIRPDIAAPINHAHCCHGPDEDVYRELMGVPPIWQECHEPFRPAHCK